ncbi:MAG: hypothetical protein ABFS56_35250 [Pseudomonadota bacterium]
MTSPPRFAPPFNDYLKQLQTGVVQQSIEIQIAPFVTEAFLIVAADALQQMTGNPPAKPMPLS